MGFADERDLALLSIISGIFILVTLSPQIGIVYFAMAAAYAIALNQGPSRVFEFIKGSRGALTVSTLVTSGILILGFIGVGSVFLGGPAAVIKSVSLFASSFLTAFTIDNAVIKFIVFGVFVPIVETLFFFGVIYKFILAKTGASGKLSASHPEMNTIIAALVVGGVATAFHFYVRLLSDSGLLSDLLFFSLSALLVSKQQEMSGAAVGHIAFNSYVMALTLGFIR